MANDPHNNSHKFRIARIAEGHKSHLKVQEHLSECRSFVGTLTSELPIHKIITKEIVRVKTVKSSSASKSGPNRQGQINKRQV
jgi:hypothetical protein